MSQINLRPASPQRDFARLAEIFTLLDDWTNTEQGLAEFYQAQQERILTCVAEEEQGALLGFYWVEFSRLEPGQVFFYLYVHPPRRGQGLGSRLFEAMIPALRTRGANRLRVSVWDDCPAGRAFADRRGFREVRHRIAMQLDLDGFDERPYERLIAGFRQQGFQFTSMAELGDTPEARRRLYALNEATSLDIPGAEGERSWESFEDFDRSVCQSDWYLPAGQMVVIDDASGEWAAMSAVTRFAGSDHAYNLHTGVERRYRGRGLGTAVKVTALRFARQNLGVKMVRTHHNTKNLPILAIDRRLGYTLLPGTYLLEKILS